MTPVPALQRRNAAAATEDGELIRNIAARDEAAFERLYKRYYPRVFRFVTGMVNDRRTVEEVVDDTLLAVWKGAAAFQARANVSTWIFGIAYRRALKTLESGRRHTYFQNDPEYIEQTLDSAPEASPEAVHLGTDLLRQIRSGIAQMSNNHRAVLLLTLMGYNYDEIAEVVECPAGTVKTRMFYARKRLKSLLPDSPALANPLLHRSRDDTETHWQTQHH